ncbi:MFS monosaccharide transporter [Apiospora saccharicola]
MASFKQVFGTWDAETGKYLFSSTRSGLIVGLLSIGNLFGALVAGPLADRLGRKLPIMLACLIYGIGAVVQITSQHVWYQVALGRWTGGLGVGALSTLVPLATSETSPTNIRGLVVSPVDNSVSGYQMSVTLGILTASLVNLGTESLPSSAAWRITMGLDFVWVSMLLLGLMFVPESPKYLFATGKHEGARNIIASLMGVQEDHPVLVRELGEMEASLQAERSSGGSTTDWKQMLRNRQIRSRILLATGILSFQQLTGVNFFFYYGTSVFAGTGISNSYITQVILGLVNVLCTVPEAAAGNGACSSARCGWRCSSSFTPPPAGSGWTRSPPQRTPAASGVLIASTALFIAGFASTWGPISWGEAAIVCPAQCRATSASLATAVYWMWSFLIAFFTPAITARINYAYGYVFGGCCLLMALMVHVCLVESQGRTMEEVDAMYSN